MGFATLPNQVHRKSVKKGFDFTLMVAGQCVAANANIIDRVQGTPNVAAICSPTISHSSSQVIITSELIHL